MKNDKIALFDFCETLANFQTADNFVHFCRHKLNSRKMRFLNFFHVMLQKLQIIRVLNKIAPKVSLNKKLTLLQLRGLPNTIIEEKADEYYNTIIKPNIIKSVHLELLKKRSEGYKIYIVSGGYDVYLKFFVNEFKLDGLFCTKIKFKDNICSGLYDGKDCLNETKVELLEQFFADKDIDKTCSYAYSDSPSDLPLLKWVANGVVVARKKTDWAINYNFKEIIWER